MNDSLDQDEEVEIIFTRDGIEIISPVQMPLVGSTRVRKELKYDDIEQIKSFEITVNSIEPMIEKHTLKSIKMKVRNFNTEINKKRKKVDVPVLLNDVPENILKKIEDPNMPNYLKKYTLDCFKKGTFAYDARNIIKNKGKLTKKELQKEMEKLSYKGTGGGYDATLHALEEVIGEIWMSGRGDGKIIVWEK